MHLSYMIFIRLVARTKQLTSQNQQCVNPFDKSFLYIGKTKFGHNGLVSDFRQRRGIYIIINDKYLITAAEAYVGLFTRKWRVRNIQ